MDQHLYSNKNMRVLTITAHQANWLKSIGPVIGIAPFVADCLLLASAGCLLPASTVFGGVHKRCASAYSSVNLTSDVAFEKNANRAGIIVRANLSYSV